MNGLKLINEFLAAHNDPREDVLVYDLGNMTRSYIVQWIVSSGHYSDQEIDLAANILIAAGIGQAAEQTATVYCKCSQCEE